MRIIAVGLLRHIALACVLASCIFLSCNKATSNKTTLTLWHFWSEPSQKKAFLHIIEDFEKEHPDIDVVPVELQWSDGKAKLQLGFASGQPPDIAHIGLEWVTQFADAGVLRNLDTALLSNCPNQLRSSVQHQGQYVALPWVMNTRALFIHKALIEHLRTADISFATPADFYSSLSTIATQQIHLPYGMGVNAYEPHNVSKKALPLIWSAGSRLFTTLPFSSTFDSAAINGLSSYCALVKNGLMESSRKLDEKLSQGQIGLWISGMWVLAYSGVTQKYVVAPAIHGGYSYTNSSAKGESILSGDCYAVSKGSAHPEAAALFLAYLSRYEVEQRFCMEIPDAGIPAHNYAKSDSALASTSGRKAFIQQIFTSRVLPSPSYYLDAEQILEEEIMEAVYAKKSAQEAMQSAQQRIALIEHSHALH